MKPGVMCRLLLTSIVALMSCHYGFSQAILSDNESSHLFEGCNYESGVAQDFYICIGNKHVGQYRTIRLEEGGLTYYCGESQVEIWLFTKVRIRYELECVFADSLLLYSRCVGYRNGRQRLVTEIVKDGPGWKARQDFGPWVKYGPVMSTMIQLYYSEPIVGATTVIEATLVHKEVVQEQDGVYRLREPGKKRVSEVIYRNGDISRVNVHFALMDFSVVKKTPSNQDCSCTESP